MVSGMVLRAVVYVWHILLIDSGTFVALPSFKKTDKRSACPS
jgi:hypothetical protein